MSQKKVKTALISVYHKEGLEKLVKVLNKHQVKILSTGGTLDYLKSLNADAEAVETVTGYPSILGGRVKTLHPKIFGGILHRREDATDKEHVKEYEIPSIDLVVVDLYPFEETLISGAGHEDIIEKIDIGGISLIRAAAKNYNDVLVVSSQQYYEEAAAVLEQNADTSLQERKTFAARAFHISSHYDTAIFNYINEQEEDYLKISCSKAKSLRYGENPHQWGRFFGDWDELFEQLHGKEISYNNIVDVDAAVQLLEEFKDETSFVIIKHTNACGVATGSSVAEAYKKALEADPVSAFGGILACNRPVDLEAAQKINELFFEILIAPAIDDDALKVLQSKKNRIILIQKKSLPEQKQVKNVLNGFIVQQKDTKTVTKDDLKVVTTKALEDEQVKALLFANKIVKHTKSNTIVLAKEGQLIASGTGQTSRVDALQQAIEKAKKFGFDLTRAVMASDAFFPFADSVEIASNEGIKAVIQPGGSVRDQDSIDFCNKNDMTMVLTGIRHFKH
jgi:phosphoribosylaminoimidazolecarboxamide formyltransferase/IMP cyclohydrolase